MNQSVFLKKKIYIRLVTNLCLPYPFPRNISDIGKFANESVNCLWPLKSCSALYMMNSIKVCPKLNIKPWYLWCVQAPTVMYKGDNAKLNTFMLNILQLSSLSLYFYFLFLLCVVISYQLGIAKALQFWGLGELKGEKTKARWVTFNQYKTRVSWNSFTPKRCVLITCSVVGQA